MLPSADCRTVRCYQNKLLGRIYHMYDEIAIQSYKKILLNLEDKKPVGFIDPGLFRIAFKGSNIFHLIYDKADVMQQIHF
jgi:hypothetical protein